MGHLAGKAALVTGGSRGIGRAIVERLASEGATVTFSYRTDADAAGDVVKAVEAGGGSADQVRCDLADAAQIVAMFDAAQSGGACLDIVVNNVGIAVASPVAETSDEEYDRIMAVNARGTFIALREAARRVRDGGRIINISTLNTALRGPGVALYAGSKAAVEQFTVAAAYELGPRGITVNAVSPGATDTEQLRAVNTVEALDAMAAASPLGRLGQPADVADVVAFLAGPDGRWMTGQNLRATGGLG